MSAASLFRFFSLPLLRKEMVERAARRRTYVLRAVFAAIIFLIFLLVVRDRLGYASSASAAVRTLRMSGIGRVIFDWVAALQLAGIYLFLPAITSGAIAGEKERGTLPLLFATPMRPWEILLQKFASVLLPILNFFLMSLPLVALAYSLGGLEAERCWGMVLALFIAAGQAAALGLASSAYCRSSTGALITTYVAGLLLFFSPILLDEMRILRFSNAGEFAFFPVYACFAPFPSVSARLGACVYILLSILVFLVLARIFLTRRAFLPPGNPLLRSLKRIDGPIDRLNRLAGNVILVKDSARLPGRDPIAWRETRKKSLGTFRYLLRILLLLEIPALVVALLALLANNRQGQELLIIFIFVLWALWVVTFAVIAAAAIPAERSNRSLDPLLATPMRGREILLQKMSGLRRLWLVFAVPMATLCAASYANTYLFRRYRYYWGDTDRMTLWGLAYIACTALSMLIYPWVTAWFCGWIGLRCKSRARAAILALLAFVVWLAGPVLLFFIFSAFYGGFRGGDDAIPYLLITTPGTGIVSTELRLIRHIDFAPGLFIALNWGFYFGAWRFFRARCLSRADALLGRVPDPGEGRT